MKNDEELIPLSRLQHLQFCPRQFALIHLEDIWDENVLTAQGRILHENADDPLFTEKRNDLIITRSVPLVSYALGLSGKADVIEFHQDKDGVALPNRKGLWHPIPVEYKRGKQKAGIEDEVQLCAQALCLIEMLGVAIPEGYIFYWETRTRSKVIFSDALKDTVRDLCDKAYYILETGKLPNPDRPIERCKRCSLIDSCVPESKTRKSALAYIKHQLEELNEVAN